MTVTALPFDTTVAAPTGVAGLGARIRHVRTAVGYIKQIDLLADLQARGLDITQSTLSAWECDKVCPRLQDLVVIAELCNVSIDYLAGLAERPTRERGVFVSDADAALLEQLRTHFAPQFTERQKQALAFVDSLDANQ
jgi:transcriptional regulator with XRE-family HTH domain